MGTSLKKFDSLYVSEAVNSLVVNANIISNVANTKRIQMDTVNIQVEGTLDILQNNIINVGQFSTNLDTFIFDTETNSSNNAGNITTLQTK